MTWTSRTSPGSCRRCPAWRRASAAAPLTWSVAGKVFAWERPYTKADIKRFGDQPYPAEPLVGVRTAGLNEKEALLASSSPAIFTMAHFDGYPAVLVDLAHVAEDELTEVLTDGWLAMAPESLIAQRDE